MNTSRSNVAVGIMSGKEISFVLNGDYAFNGSIFKGQNSATISKERFYSMARNTKKYIFHLLMLLLPLH